MTPPVIFIQVTAVVIPRELCVVLSTPSNPAAVSFEAQDSEVHEVLVEGLQLLLADAHSRAREVLLPVFISSARAEEQLVSAFMRMRGRKRVLL